jgi:hypothetical protein
MSLLSHKFLDHQINIYEILNIPTSIISNDDYNVNHFLALIADSSNCHNNLIYINQVISIIEKFHSYFHFEQSWAYTICAYTKCAAGNFDNAKHFLAKALFQDPINEFAINLPSNVSAILAYGKNF